MLTNQTAFPHTLTRRRYLELSGFAVAGSLVGLTGAAATPAPEETTPEAGPAPRAINVAMVLGAHNTLIDFAGPWEVFSSGGYAGGAFNVYSVASTRTPVLCDDGRGFASMHVRGMPLSALTVVPDYTFEEAPQPQITLIGGQASDDDREKKTVDWIRAAARKANLTASVCTGAFLLAKSGLLDGHPATTNRNAYDDFQKTFPKVRLVRGVRFVQSGAVASATGLTAGIDLALHIVQQFYGQKVAHSLAGYEEWTSKAWLEGGGSEPHSTAG